MCPIDVIPSRGSPKCRARLYEELKQMPSCVVDTGFEAPPSADGTC